MINDTKQSTTLSRQLLIYIPAFNCADYIVGVVDEIPEILWGIADILVIDNCSTDRTVEQLQQARAEKRWPDRIHLVQPKSNLGYSGSQKLAYRIALDSPNIQNVIMLHGDGQYPPELLNKFVPFVGSEYGLVYGFRDKSSYREKEETPLLTYWTIKFLGSLESFVTGYKRKEWHNGFVMYSREFLSNINFSALTDTYHIDGHIQFIAGELKEKIIAVPIWKRYKNYEQLKGLNRLTYIFHVLGLMVKFRVLGSGQSNAEYHSKTYEYSTLPELTIETDQVRS
jgi:glycosyltransferase involved in cell wall biosynthesis